MREERDSMGGMCVPEDALYGASTQRAVLNFPISAHRMPARFIKAMGLLKLACARANADLGLLAHSQADVLVAAARELIEGKLDQHFPVDVFQTGSATSSNMNANEVLANRASQLAGQPLGSKNPLHPNDDVNLGQSSNDTMPSALHISLVLLLQEVCLPALRGFASTLRTKAHSWKGFVKMGRTHLMDATPITFGQVFGGYATQIERTIGLFEVAQSSFLPLALGGTAVGTGLNAHPEMASRACSYLSEETGFAFVEAADHVEAQSCRDACVAFTGAIQAACSAFLKILNDIRFMASGPRAGLAELTLPAIQPGSSIMPGKTNPVLCESLAQACFYAQGLSHCVVLAGGAGHFELNTHIPLMAHAFHEGLGTLFSALQCFEQKALKGLEVNRKQCEKNVERSLMLVTALTPHIGYDRAAHVAKTAFERNASIREVVLEENLMDPEALDQALDPQKML